MAMASGIKAGDEVLVPNYTMVATPNSLKMFGAEPKFIDVNPKTLCISINEIEKNISAKTKAVFLMNANGRYPSDIEEIINFCKQKNIMTLMTAHHLDDSLETYFMKKKKKFLNSKFVRNSI